MSSSIHDFVQPFLNAVWSLMCIPIPGFGFSFGGMLIGIVMVSISLSILKSVFTLAGNASGGQRPGSKAPKAKISSDRKDDAV